MPSQPVLEKAAAPSKESAPAAENQGGISYNQIQQMPQNDFRGDFYEEEEEGGVDGAVISDFEREVRERLAAAN